MSSANGKSILNLLGAVILGIIGLWLVYTLFVTGFGVISTISLLLMFLIKVLFVLFIVGLVAGIAAAIKNYVFTEEDIRKIKETLAGRKTDAIKKTCTDCGRELNDEWRVCPFCGNEKETINA